MRAIPFGNMTLTPGTRIGAYEIVSIVGAGGMGEVYRARDPKLQRDVALKILPEIFASDPDRLARFEREARTLASLSHPHVAGIYGFEQCDGVHALALEFVPGETLADLIARGPIPIEEALPIARQIAEALEAAHEQGIIHRDLKPANIKIALHSVVKVLDFGLAKLIDPPGAAPTSTSPSLSPTITSAAVMTQAGMLLGTAAYMAPEQAKGKPADRRSDIWAFGCILFEMLTGARAFEGEDVSETLASILRSEPRISELPADTPMAVRRMLHRCLQKDPRRRLQHIGDARLELAEANEHQLEPTQASTSSRVPFWTLLAGTMAGVVATASVMWVLQPRVAATPVVRFQVSVPDSTPLEILPGGGVALSPDGRTLLYVSSKPRVIMRRYRDVLGFEAVPDTEDGRAPFFSPDGAWIGFFAGVQLRKVPVTGGVAITICDVPDGATAAWGPDDTIVVARDHLYRVPASGGNLTLVVDSSGDPFAEPVFVRDSETILVRRGAPSQWRIDAVELGTGRIHRLLEGSSPKLASTGDLLFLRRGGIWATRFDVARLAVYGPPVPLIPSVSQVVPRGALFDTARDGSLAYVPGLGENSASLVWLDRTGQPSPALKDRLAFQSPRLSPDGKRVALSIVPDVWIYELERGSRTRLTTEGISRRSVWSWDGAQIATYSTPPGSNQQDLFVVPSSGGPSKRLLARPGLQYPDTWSKDGRFLVFEDGEQGGGSRRDLWLLPIGGEPQPLLSTRFYERGAVISPDGDWLAFVTDESGRAEVYVQRFPGSGPKLPVSNNGGVQPMWARSGRELFYREGEALMAVSFQPQPPAIGAPTKLFEMPAINYGFDPNFADYDVAPDGHFLAVRREATRSAEIYVVLNFAEELRRALPR